MNFGTHLRKIAECIDIALGKDKAGIVDDFRPILNQAGVLLRSPAYGFWLRCLGEIPIDEIPMTEFGHSEAIRLHSRSSTLDRTNIASHLDTLCHYLFTYCDDEDMCPLQSEYHYFMHRDTSQIIKMSLLGMADPSIGITPDNVRIAMISELDIPTTSLFTANKAMQTDHPADGR